MISRRPTIALCLAAWVLAVAAGAKVTWDYQTTAAAPGEPARAWPAASRVPPPAGGRGTLVLVAHPQCPCTRATVQELSRLLSGLRGRVSAHVLFYRPREFPAGWERTDVWETVERIPGVGVHVDVDGYEAARFGALTSGQVLLYDARGRLRFSGGLTSVRGHVGESAGHQRIAAAVEGSHEGFATTRVFGCRLAGPPGAD